MLGIDRVNHPSEPSADKVYKHFPADRVGIRGNTDKGYPFRVKDVVEFVDVHCSSADGTAKIRDYNDGGYWITLHGSLKLLNTDEPAYIGLRRLITSLLEFFCPLIKYITQSGRQIGRQKKKDK